MKNKKLWTGILIITLVLGITLAGCKNEPDEPKYTVWTDTDTYVHFNGSFGALEDGYYLRYEFTSSEWSTISPSLTNEGKNNWKESEIKKYFIGRGFGDSEAQEATAWLITVKHGFIASRSGSVVYMIVK
jgi:hypothetical protein